MTRVLRTLYGVLMAVWVGAMAYFSALLTPTLMRVFPERFGEIVAALFPGYFRLGEILAGAAVLAAVAEWRAVGGAPERKGALWRLLIAAVALGVVAYNREILLSQAHAARGTDAFWRLHGLSMALNVVAAVLALAGSVISYSGEGRHGTR